MWHKALINNSLIDEFRFWTGLGDSVLETYQINYEKCFSGHLVAPNKKITSKVLIESL